MTGAVAIIQREIEAVLQKHCVCRFAGGGTSCTCEHGHEPPSPHVSQTTAAVLAGLFPLSNLGVSWVAPRNNLRGSIMMRTPVGGHLVLENHLH